jgi:cytochrome c-type biogenesis protein CcmH
MIGMVLAFAIAASEPELSPQDEARARALDSEIRCVQCVNEPIAQSTSDIAEDMRGLIRERVAAGDSDADIRGFFAERYGDQVLFRPPLRQETLLLWLSPIVLGLIALLCAAPLMRRRGAASEPEDGQFDPEDR